MKRLLCTVTLGASLLAPVSVEAGGAFSASRVDEVRAGLRYQVPGPKAALDGFEIEAWLMEDARLRALDRAGVEAAQLQALKFEWMVWRSKVTEHLLYAPVDEDDELERLRLRAIAQLASRPSAGSLRRLKRRLGPEHRTTMARLAARFGHPKLARRWSDDAQIDRLAGPTRKLDIIPSAPSKWPLERWAKKGAFEDYLFTDSGVHYRGLELQSGDVFLLHMHEHSDGMYTSYADPEQLFPHFGLFVILDYKGKRLPAVLEIHRMGLRAIPLAAYFQPTYSDYVEVYRIPDRAKPVGFEARLSAAAIQAEAEPHAYGLDPAQSLASQRHYLTCGQVGSMLFERAGVQPWLGLSAPTAGAHENLATLDLDLGPYLTPTDYVFHPGDPNNDLRLVGVIDNGALPSMMARHFIITQVGHWLTTKTLELSRFGVDYRVKHWAMQHWEARDKMGHFLVKAFGFTEDNFPGGPAKLMAAIDSLEHGVVAAVEQTGEEFEKLGTFERSLDAATHGGGFDYEVWMELPELHRLAERTARGFLRYFRDEAPV
jgi:hypothetical protein